MRLGLQRGFLVAAMFCVLAGPGHAEAAERVATTKGSVFAQPLFAGGGIVWSESRCLRPCEDGNSIEEQTIRLARPGARPRTVFRGRRGIAQSGPNGFFSQLAYTASGSYLAVLKSDSAEDEFSSINEDTLSVGRLGGSLRRVFRCKGQSVGGSPQETVFTLTGDTLVYRPGPCRPAERRIVALDLGEGTREVIPQPREGRPAELDAEGAFVSYELTIKGFAREYVVYDRATGAEAYSVALPQERDIIASDLQRDGKVALITRTIAESDDECRGYTLSWYSIDEPTPHDLTVNACRGPVAISGDRIVFASAQPRPQSLTVTDLAGQARQLADFGGFLDLDSRADRVTYGLRNCAGGSDFFVQRFDEPIQKDPPAGCPVRIASKRLRATRNRVLVRLRCPRGCKGRVSLRGLDGRKLALQDYAFGSSETKAVVLRLNRRGRLRLRRSGQLRVTIKALTYDPAFRIQRTSKPGVLLRAR
jgi:hypothetical protein